MDNKEKQNKSWGEEFDEEFPDAEGYEVNYNKEKLKHFISQKIDEARNEGYEEGARNQMMLDVKEIKKARVDGLIEGLNIAMKNLKTR